MNTIVYFEIQSSEPSREIAFYSQLFGWEFQKEERLPVEYYRIRTSGLAGALLRRPAIILPAEYGTNAFTCSMEVTDFDRTAETILHLGGQVAFPKFAVPGRCWQGYFTDPDRNVFGIFQVDKNAH